MELEHKMELLVNTLRRRLTAKGMDGTAIPAYLRNVTNMLAADSLVSLWELNSRLRLLGWDDFELDDYSLELVRAVFEQSTAHKSPVYFEPDRNSKGLDELSDDQKTSMTRHIVANKNLED